MGKRGLQKNMERHREVMEVFKKVGSYTGTAKVIGISRQRVDQIITGYTTIDRRSKNKEIVFGLCSLCKRSNATNIHHKDLDSQNNNPQNLQKLCTSCHGLIHRFENKKKYGNTCKICRRVFDISRKTSHFLMKEQTCSSCKANGYRPPKRAEASIYCRVCRKIMFINDRQKGCHVKCFRSTEEYKKYNALKQRKRRERINPKIKPYRGKYGLHDGSSVVISSNVV